MKKDFIIRLIEKRGIGTDKSIYIWETWKDRIIYALLSSNKPLTAYNIGQLWNIESYEKAGCFKTNKDVFSIKKGNSTARQEWNKIEPRCKELEELGIITKTSEGYDLNYEQFAFCFLSSILHRIKNPRTKKEEVWIMSKDKEKISEEKVKCMAKCFKTDLFKGILIKFLSKEDMAKAKHKEIGLLKKESKRTSFFQENIFEVIYQFFDLIHFAIVNPNIIKLIDFNMSSFQNFLVKETNMDKSAENFKNIFYDKEGKLKPESKEVIEAITVFNELARPREKVNLEGFLEDTIKNPVTQEYIDTKKSPPLVCNNLIKLCSCVNINKPNGDILKKAVSKLLKK